MEKERVVIKKCFFDNYKRQRLIDLGPYSIVIEKTDWKGLVNMEYIGFTYSKKMNNHFVLFYSPHEGSERVTGVKDETFDKRTLSGLLRKKAREIGENNTNRAILKMILNHAKSLDW